MRVAIDMDGVVCDLSTTWLRRLADQTGYWLDPADVSRYDIMGLLPDGFVRHVARRLVRDGSMFLDLEPYPGAVDAIRDIASSGCDIKFVTMALSADVAAAKVSWVERHFPGWGVEHVLLTHDKDWVHAQYVIDDAPHFLEAYAAQERRPNIIGVPHPYNANSAGLCDLWAEPGSVHMARTWTVIKNYILDSSLTSDASDT